MIALRLGAALVDRSVLERADDVFLLFLDELALVNDPSDLGTTIARRRTEDERVSPDGAATLTGVPASRGTYVGTARIVTSPAEFGRLARGDVLVAVSTSPSWRPVFQIAGAVVTQIGSPTSHARSSPGSTAFPPSSPSTGSPPDWSTASASGWTALAAR